ncbi:Protein of unknown function (DUF2948) [Dongia mobilis]|uniref:DUF2948 family protein n=2 Tax=Dongia mobilis TaxID=578943 RepID=A0A4R6WD52_9PROT|nr:Protein of unknown function (DUF2948) [Dongia mobilis]
MSGGTVTDFRVMAKDRDDLAVIAACLQDALVPLSEIRYLAQENRFIMLLNRFRWERNAETGQRRSPQKGDDASFHDADDYHDTEQRIHCGLCVDLVSSVRSRGIDLKKRGAFLSLLTMQFDDGQLTLLFSGGGMIQLTVDELSVYLKDMGEGWPTQWRPDHQLGRAGS